MKKIKVSVLIVLIFATSACNSKARNQPQGDPVVFGAAAANGSGLTMAHAQSLNLDHDSRVIPENLAEKSKPSSGSNFSPDQQGPTMLNLLFAYSPEVVAASGGEATLRTNLDLYGQEINQALVDSQVQIRFRRVGKKIFTSLPQTPDLQTDLIQITNPTDGVADDLQAYKQAHGIHFVVVIEHWPSEFPPSYCGFGNQLVVGSPSWRTFAISAVYDKCLTFETVVHELGHTMGCAHHWAAESGPSYQLDLNGDGIPESIGYAEVNIPQMTGDLHAWGTIMTGGPFDNPPVIFSNPELSYFGVPAGRYPGQIPGNPHRASMCAQALNDARQYFVQFY